MIDKVFFETTDGAVYSSDDFGLILKSFDAPEPKAKTYRVSIDGADGDLDMTEWAGVVRFENRTVSVAFRDMASEGYKRLVNLLHGRKCKITLSSDPDWYFTGRCESVNSRTRSRITDTPLTFTCSPYKSCRFPTVIRQTVGENTAIMLKAARKSAIPTVTVTAACTLTYDGATVSLAAGPHTVPAIVIADSPKTLTVTGSGTITIQWTEGVI